MDSPEFAAIEAGGAVDGAKDCCIGPGTLPPGGESDEEETEEGEEEEESCPAMDTPFISDTAFTSESSDLDQDMVGQTLCTVRGRESNSEFGDEDRHTHALSSEISFSPLQHSHTSERHSHALYTETTVTHDDRTER